MDNKPYTYDHIPTLEELLPKTGGLPGVTYAIIALENARKAQDQGWSRLAGSQKIFTVESGSGSVDCELYGLGKPIRGQDVASGRRECVVDKKVSSIFKNKAEAKPEAKTTAKAPNG